jgi:hypothetical protein
MKRAVVVLFFLVGACEQPEGPLLGGLAAEEPAGRLALDGPDTYDGQWMCRLLMQASGVEAASRCPAGADDPGQLELPGRAGCLRDSYVFTAIAYCWRSECLARQGVTEADVLAGRAASSPERESRWARKMLADASTLCGSEDPAAACTTSGIVACTR